MREDRMQLPMSFSFTSNSLTSKSHSLTHSLSLSLVVHSCRFSLLSNPLIHSMKRKGVFWVDTGIHLTHLHHFFVQSFVQLHFIGDSVPSLTVDRRLQLNWISNPHSLCVHFFLCVLLTPVWRDSIVHLSWVLSSLLRDLYLWWDFAFFIVARVLCYFGNLFFFCLSIVSRHDSWYNRPPSNIAFQLLSST